MTENSHIIKESVRNLCVPIFLRDIAYPSPQKNVQLCRTQISCISVVRTNTSSVGLRWVIRDSTDIWGMQILFSITVMLCGVIDNSFAWELGEPSSNPSWFRYIHLFANTLAKYINPFLLQAMGWIAEPTRSHSLG